ncbi:hypothetical protein [Caenispirillum bisanense]|uniref:hypothetical protein n=1 Tax=Caenispirillum bisanense TaxID=414052 RepID=UPI0031DBC6A4
MSSPRPPAAARAAAALAVAALLAACAEAPPLGADRGGITLIMDDSESAMSDAVDTANRHCVGVSRLALLQDVTETPDGKVAVFDCVDV